jgi:phytoene synthase
MKRLMSGSMAGTTSARAIASGDRICRRITHRYAKTFYFASHCLPRDVRRHAYAIYGFCRWADNAVDEAPDVESARHRVERARSMLDLTYSDAPAAPGLLAFRRTVRERDVPKHLFDALLDGMEMDLTITRYATSADLDLYCYRVAGVVGLMMTHVFGYRDDRCFSRAEALGRAMQLTNILRDVREDLDRGRVYLPQDAMVDHGVTEDQLHLGQVDANFRALMRGQIERARHDYHESNLGIADLVTPSGRLTVRVMGRLYSRILDAIERLDYDVFRARAHVTTSGKLRGLAQCAWDEWGWARS